MSELVNLLRATLPGQPAGPRQRAPDLDCAQGRRTSAGHKPEGQQGKEVLVSPSLALQANILLIGCGLFFPLLAVQYFHKIHHAPTRSAFLRWSNQLDDLRHGINIWEVHEYPNPPIMALVLLPFSLLPGSAGAMTWFGFKALLTLLAIQWIWRWLDISWSQNSLETTLVDHGQAMKTSFPSWAKILLLLPAISPIVGDLTHGNVNLFIMFLIMAGLYTFVRGRDLEAGLLLGAAIACRLTPLLFVPYLAWKRAWLALAGCALSMVLLWGLIPGLVFGLPSNAEFFSSWVGKIVVPFVLHGKVTSEHQNQSLPGLAHRLLTHSPSISERVGTEYFAREYHNLAEASPAMVGWLIMLLMAGYVVLMLRVCRTPLHQRRDWRLMAEFALVILGMLLFSERTWKHHCVTLLLPGAVVAFHLASASPRRTFPLWSALSLAGLLMISAGSGFFPGQVRYADLAQVYGCYTWALLILLAILAWALRARD